MASTLVINGVGYSFPGVSDENWGQNVSNWASAVSSHLLQKTGGTFTLSAEVDFGNNYGLKSLYYKSRATNPSSSGILRLGNAESVSWRNQANNADLALSVNSSDVLQYNGTKLTLSGAIVDADIDAAAAIAYSKLALSNSIVNADINASAAIAFSKLAALTTSRALQSNTSTGFIEASSVTNTELGYLSGVTSAVQTQVDAKQSRSTLTTKGDLYVATASATVTRQPVGTNGYALVADSAQSTGLNWASVLTNPMTTGGDLIYGGASGVATRLANGSAGQTLVSQGSTNAPVWQNFQAKNYIINGDMRISQRGTSFVSPANSTYTLDRFVYGKNGSMTHTVSQDTDVPTFAQAGYLFRNSLRLNLTAADTSISASEYNVFTQKIEGHNFAHFAQKAFTLSFWVKATTTGTYCVAFVNSGDDRSYIAEYTINTTNTWEYKTINVPASPSSGTWDYTNGRGLSLHWALASGSTYHTTANAWQTGLYLATSNQVNGVNTGSTNFYITGIMLNEGTVAMPFRTFNQGINGDIEACQRYYEKSYNLTVNPASLTYDGATAWGMATSDGKATAFFKTRKRANPTVTTYSPADGASGAVARDSGGVTSVTWSVQGYSETTFFGTSGSTGNSTGNFWMQWTADAEL